MNRMLRHLKKELEDLDYGVVVDGSAELMHVTSIDDEGVEATNSFTFKELHVYLGKPSVKAVEYVTNKMDARVRTLARLL